MDRINRRLAAGCLGICAMGGTLALAGVAGASTAYEAGARGRVASVEGGDSLTLAGGQVVRLAQIEAPRIRDGDPAGPQARAALQGLVGTGAMELRYGGLRRDRRGRALAQVFVP